MAKRGAVVAGAVGAGVAAALASFNLFMKSRGGVLPSPVEAAERWVDTDDGRVRVYEAGSGAPLVLLHSFNAAASTYEMRPLFEAFAPERRVIAFDWLGFGLSERPALRYSAETYQRLLERVLDRVLSGPADVIALSLPSQYVAIAAGRRPERFRRIICLSPTGFGRFTARGRPSGVIATALLRAPLLGQALYNGLTTELSIRWFLRDLFADPTRLPDDYVAYAVATARQAGARFAPASFVGGLLNAPAAEEAYRTLRTPTLFLFGDHPRFTDPAAAPALVAANENLMVENILDSGDLPHWERPDAALAAIRAFLSAGDSVERRSAAAGAGSPP